MHVLVVDDNLDFRKLVEIELIAHDMGCISAASRQEALDCLAERPEGYFDLIILDLKMPGGSGHELLMELRSAGNNTPVIFVSGVDEAPEKIRGFDLGADDYVVKPVDMDELLARIAAVLRRRRSLEPIRFGDITVDVAHRRVARGPESIELSPREFDLMVALVEAKGELVTRDNLLKDIWGVQFDPGTNVLDVHIGRLRKKLDKLGDPMIHNVRGKGFRVAIDSKANGV